MVIFIEQSKMNKPFSTDQEMLLLCVTVSLPIEFLDEKVKRQTFAAQQFFKAEQNQRVNGITIITYYYTLFNLLKLG